MKSNSESICFFAWFINSLSANIAFFDNVDLKLSTDASKACIIFLILFDWISYLLYLTIFLNLFIA
jgi:hypothetical protein